MYLRLGQLEGKWFTGNLSWPVLALGIAAVTGREALTLPGDYETAHICTICSCWEHFLRSCPRMERKLSPEMGRVGRERQRQKETDTDTCRENDTASAKQFLFLYP